MFTGELSAHEGVIERDFLLTTPFGAVPGTLWMPSRVTAAPPLVLLGYGSGGYRADDSRRWQAGWLAKNYGLAAVSIDHCRTR